MSASSCLTKKNKPQLSLPSKSKQQPRRTHNDHDVIHDPLLGHDLAQGVVSEVDVLVLEAEVEVAADLDEEGGPIAAPIQGQEQGLDLLERIVVDDMTIIVMMIMIEAKKLADIGGVDQDRFLGIEREHLIDLNQDQ